MSDPTTLFQKQLEASSGRKLKLKINDNRSTILSLRWGFGYTHVSLHRMFLQAPANIMDALACYIKGKGKGIFPEIKAFIDHELRGRDYAHKVNTTLLSTQGQYFDLQEIYNELNADYFEGQLNLRVTWYGEPKRRLKSQINLGLYSDALKMIKVHRLLDHFQTPDYFIRFIVYHEMVHNVCPPRFVMNGRSKIHTEEFKIREKMFKDYELAQKWVKENKKSFFR